jgi:hypothetical protein
MTTDERCWPDLDSTLQPHHQAGVSTTMARNPHRRVGDFRHVHGIRPLVSQPHGRSRFARHGRGRSLARLVVLSTACPASAAYLTPGRQC